MLGHEGTNKCSLQIWEMEAAFVGVFERGQGGMQPLKNTSCEVGHKNSTLYWYIVVFVAQLEGAAECENGRNWAR